MSQYGLAISRFHRMYSLPDPYTHQLSNLLRGLSNMYDRAPSQAPGLLRVHLDAIRKMQFTPEREETACDAQRRKLLFIALASTMRDALLRSDEAADLTWADIEYLDTKNGDGLVFIRRSKTDQYKNGDVAYLSATAMRDLENIRGEASPETSVFGLSRRQIYSVIRKTMKLAGFAGRFTAHSPRRGMAIDLKRARITLADLKRAGRWRWDGTAIHYTLDDSPALGAVAEYYRRRANREGREPSTSGSLQRSAIRTPTTPSYGIQHTLHRAASPWRQVT